jgi:hypothetical protein
METYKRAVGESVSQGYRQLPSVGNTRGPELKTIVYAGVGVVMGILVGTFVADGSLRIPGAFSIQPVVHAVASNAAQGTHPAAKAATAKAQTTPVPAQAAAAQVQQADGQSKTAPGKTAPAQVQLAFGEARSVPVALPTAVTRVSVTSKPSPIRTVSQVPAVDKVTVRNRVSTSHRVVYTPKRRTGRRLAAWRRHLSRRAALSRHRVELARTAEIADVSFSSGKVFTPIVPDSGSAFTVEGEVTVVSYDSSEGVIDTYEGETFALDKTLVASNAVSGDDIPSNLHYRCDQFRNCSLILDGQSVSNVRRTR